MCLWCTIELYDDIILWSTSIKFIFQVFKTLNSCRLKDNYKVFQQTFIIIIFHIILHISKNGGGGEPIYV